MKWPWRKRVEPQVLPVAEPPRELTGVEKMEIEWRGEAARAREKRQTELRAKIAAIRATIQPQLDEIARLEQELEPQWWRFQNAYAQQQSLATGLEGYGGLLGSFGGLGSGLAR